MQSDMDIYDPPLDTDIAQLETAYQSLRGKLLAEQTPAGHWTGELSTSALSTATAVMAMEMVRRDRERRGDDSSRLGELIQTGAAWLIAHQNEDGGWGDTVKSYSNISTTMLCRASLAAAGTGRRGDGETGRLAIERAGRYIETAGGISGLKKRYGKDKTFSVPILTHCALAGLVDWREIPALPFELACIPARWYAAARLPVVSYALPALIAIGQVRHHFAPTRNPLTRAIRNRTRRKSLEVLSRIQPENGGFLEATPLTSFVTMSLAGMGRSDHPVAVKGAEFITGSVLPDGSWPIDTNLATWVTTLAVNALGDDLPEESREPIRRWLLDQQYTEIHPYTNAAPGGWAWTNLPGGVPDADDSSGAILALMNLASPRRESGGVAETFGIEKASLDCAAARSLDASSPHPPANAGGSPFCEGERRRASEAETREAIDKAIRWLVGLQNRDGGFPTFCRGWGTLPFDRSSPDITAHAIRALIAWHLSQTPREQRGQAPPTWQEHFQDEIYIEYGDEERTKLFYGAVDAILVAWHFLRNAQRPDGSWLPLWFGNQDAHDDVNPTYGTARVLAAFRDAGLADDPACRRGVVWLLANQNEDGGWGGRKGPPSSVEETALAVEILASLAIDEPQVWRGVQWLVGRIESRTIAEPSPIGFYFAKLWYFERLYPLIFTVGALGSARRALKDRPLSGHDGSDA